MTKRFLALALAVALAGVGGVNWQARAGYPADVEKKFTADEIKGLVDKLGSDDFKTRTAARKDLVAAGPAALEALEKATQSTDKEVAEQAKGAIRDIKRSMADVATAAIAKNHLWCYEMEKGAGWLQAGAWPLIVGDTAYVVGNDAKLHAVDIKTGKGKWQADLAAKPAAAGAGGGGAAAGPAMMIPMGNVTQASAGEKYVSLVQQMKLTVLDTKEGKVLWQKEFQAGAPPMMNGGPKAVPLQPGPGVAPAGGGANVPPAGAGGGPVAKPGVIVAGPIVPIAPVAPAGGGVAAGGGANVPAAGGGAAAGPGVFGAGKFPMALSRPEAWVVGDMVVVRTDKLTAYKGQTGEEVWQMDYKPATSQLCTSVTADGVVFLGTEDSVAAVDVAGKKELWKKEMPGCVKMMAGGGTLVCAAGTKLVALDAKKGDKLWDAEVVTNAPGPNGGGGINLGGALGGGPAMMPPMNMMVINRMMATDQTRVYLVNSGTLTTYDLKTGAKFEGPLDMGAEEKGGAAAGGGGASTTVVPPNGAAAGGGVMMVAPSPFKVMVTRLAAADGKLYGTTNKGIYAFDGKSGAQLWMLPLARMLPTEPVVVGDVLYYATNANMMFGAGNGAPQIKPLPPQPVGPPQQIKPLPPGIQPLPHQPVAGDAAAPKDVAPKDLAGLHALKLPK